LAFPPSERKWNAILLQKSSEKESFTANDKKGRTSSLHVDTTSCAVLCFENEKRKKEHCEGTAVSHSEGSMAMEKEIFRNCHVERKRAAHFFLQ